MENNFSPDNFCNIVNRRSKWDLRYLELAKDISNWSKDPSSKVGSVIVKDNRIVGTGYNGFASDIRDLFSRLDNREEKYKFTIHAEMNAILQAGKNCIDATMYTYPMFGDCIICDNCCKHAIQAGIKRFVGLRPEITDPSRDQRWKDSWEFSKQMLIEANRYFYSYNYSDLKS